jgi:hypothetical protein
MRRPLTILTVAVLSFAIGTSVSFFTLPAWIIFVINAAKVGPRTDWLGFFGSIIAGSMTLVAATAAWLAVRSQIVEQRRSVEAQRRDAADVRLTAFLTAFFNLYNEYEKIKSAGDPIRKDRQLETFRNCTTSADIVAALTDPLMGQDANAVSYFINVTRTAAFQIAKMTRAEEWKTGIIGRYETIAQLLYRDLTNNVPARRQIMRSGTVEDLTNAGLINLRRYFRFLSDGVLEDRPEDWT